MRFNLLAALLSCLAMGACDFGTNKYEITRAGTETFLLNKQNGQASLLDGGTATPIWESAPTRAASAPSATKATAWPTTKVPQLGDLMVSPRTTYRDGQMLYIIVVDFNKPIAAAFQEPISGARLNVGFDDVDGFTVTTVGAPVKGGLSPPTRIVNEKGEPILLQWRGSVPMSRDTYQSIASVDVGWAGFDSQK